MALRFKFRWKRIRVMWRRWKRKVDSLKPDYSIQTNYEEKGLRLWRMVIRDEDTQMAYNTNGVRQIEKEHLFIIFTYLFNSNFYKSWLCTTFLIILIFFIFSYFNTK